jgi:Tfp pilus assembly protein PilV
MKSLKFQRGDFLIEAMVGALIVALVSLGTLAISTRVMLTQEEMVRQETIVTTLREKLHNNDKSSAANNPCAANPADRTFNLPNRGQVSYTVHNCAARQVSYIVGGKTYVLTLPLADMSVNVPVNATDTAEYSLGEG